MSRPNLVSELSLRPLCCDGAMGTQLLARGLASGDCGMLWNIDRPRDVSAIHAAYAQAGCDLVTTNSFGGTRFALETHGCAGRVAELNRAAARVARQTAGDSNWVLGDVGPFGGFLAPVGDVSPAELRPAFAEQIIALLEGGADAILVETMSDPAEAALGVEAAKSCRPDIPVIATYAFQKTAGGAFRTMTGAAVEIAIRTAVDAGADIVGANCGTDLALPDYVELARQIAQHAGSAKVMVQPNAGSPHMRNGEIVYDASPEQMAKLAGELLGAGVRIVGGCCGTAPEHLAAMSRAVHGSRS
ncbi:MAG: homocysteine S-methyltransferase family protein [Verrucomicrobiota bacterium]